MKKTELDKFMHDVELLIPVRDSKSKRFLAELGDSISDFLEENEEADIDAVVAEFGSPKDIALDYIESLDAEDLIKHIETTKLIRKLLAIVAIAAIVALSVYSYYQYRGYKNYRDSIISKEETIIIYGEEKDD